MIASKRKGIWGCHLKGGGDSNITRWSHERYPMGIITSTTKFNGIIGELNLLDILLSNGVNLHGLPWRYQKQSLLDRFFISKGRDLKF